MKRDKLGGSGTRVAMIGLAGLGLVVLFSHLPNITIFAAEVYSSGDITFTDSTGNPLYGEITISTGDESQKLPESDYYIGWASVPDTAIYFNALATKNASLGLKISGDSLDGGVIIENYGASLPENVNIPAPGVPIKYVEIGIERVSFSEAEVTIQYSDAELKGLGEKALAIYRYDSENLTWGELVTEIDEVNNTLSTKVYMLSLFAVSGKPEKIEKIEKPKEKIEKPFVKIDVLDAKNIPVVGDIKTYDEAKTLRKEVKASALLPEEVPERGELEIDALASKNVAVKLKISRASGGEIILDDYGKINPVQVQLPGKAVKFVEIGASNISYSYAEVTIRYSEAELEGTDEGKLTIYHWNGASWEALPTQVDAGNNLLSASTTSLSAFGVAAPGAPTQLIAFTDRDVYLLGEPYDVSSGGTAWTDKNFIIGIQVKVYVATLDGDGNLIRSLSGLSLNATLKDNARFFHNASTASHSDTQVTNGNWWNTFNTTFVDRDGDGIWETSFNLSDAEQLSIAQGASRADQFNITVTINETTRNLTQTTYILFSRNGCGHSSKNIAALTPDIHQNNNNHPGVTCALCHWGWEHKMGVHGNNTALGDNVSTQPSLTNAATGGWNYNTGTEDGTATTTFKDAGRSDICVACHNSNTVNQNILDLDSVTVPSITDANGDGINDNDRPSCSWAQGATAEGTWAGVGCHDNGPGNTSGTIIEKVPLKNSTHYFLNWSWKTNGAGKSYAHNRTESNVSCELCHGNHEVKGLPNASGSLTDINEQCWLCHNISGGYLNITSNGGTAVAHSSTNCKACHKDASSKLDVHSVPTAAMTNCTNCHNVGGTATGKLVNFTSMNRSMHANLNKNATSSAGNISNKPCWACHGTINGTYANESDQPSNSHNETVYRNPRKCQDCHNDTLALLNAKPVTDHIPSGLSPNTDVNTSSYNNTYCSYCHNNSIGASFDPDGLGLGGGSPVNASVSHYGANKTQGRLMTPTNNSTDCVYCHRNSSNMATWGILSSSLANISNKNGTLNTGTNHNSYTSSSQCSTCHGGYTVTTDFTFHNGALGNGSAAGGRNCTLCHDIGQSVPKVDVSRMNQSNSIHNYTNSNATASIPDNRRCWGCHTNNSVAADNVVNESELPENEHPDGFDNPRKCTQCHIDNRFGALVVSEHYTAGADIRTRNYSNINDSCINCHNKSEMIIANNDPGGPLSEYANVSHYGDNKTTNTTYVVNGNATCTYCHNASSAFTTEMVDAAWNSSVNNHTNLGTNPDCTNSTCHSSGRIHVSSLAKPEVNSTLCISCHTTQARHNSTVECSSCHLETNRSIHPVQYLQPDSTFKINSIANRSTAVNCTDCHQNQTGFTGFADAPRIPSVLKHSSNLANGSLWNSTATPYWTISNGSCYYCHNNTKHNVTALGLVNNLLNDPNNTRNGSLAITTWCADCHYNDSINAYYNGTRWTPVPPLITVNNTGKSNWQNHSTYLSLGYRDSKCKACHALNGTYLETSLNYSHSLDPGIVGGANCTNCHNVGGTAGTGRLVNFTAMNSSDAVHRNLNNNAATTLPSENKRCWACHSNGSEPPANEHPTNYRQPYNCTDCHIPGAAQNFNFTPNTTLLNVTQHYWNGTNITTANATSCYACHNRSEMMLGSFDPDGAASVYSGANGGNSSTSHYGKKRNDLASMDSTAYCSYCHNNATNNITFFVNDFNNTIVNHSAGATTPLCSANDCHSSGRIHNSTLQKPVSNDSLCIICHGTGGSAVTNNKVRHKGLNCTECHANASTGTLAGRDIHAVKYLLQNNTFSTSNSSAVNCTTCHQTTNVDSSFAGFSAFKIVSPMHHSDNASNGSVWDSYWTNTSPQTACIYCHNNTIHNNTPLGRILQWNPNYVLYGAIGTNLTCSDCHYRGDSNYSQMNSTFVAAGLNTPPEITNGTNWKGNFSNYLNHSLDTYNDQKCRNCHGSLLSVSANMSEFAHNIAVGVAGGANCTECHNVGGTAGTGRLINFTAMNSSEALHKNLNSNASISNANYSVNRKCWACHGNGSEPPAAEHPTNYRQPYNCTDCHVASAEQNLNFTPNNTLLNVTQHFWNGTGIKTPNVSSCYDCHNKSEMMLNNVDPDGAGTGVYNGANGGNNSTSHYGRNRPDLRTWDSGMAVNCSYCHQNTSTSFASAMINPAYNSSIANHSLINSPGCTNSTCHNSSWIHNSTLTRPALPLPNSTYCQSCHADRQKHNGTQDCSKCHINTTSNDTIHPVKYVQANGTYSTSNTSAANCTNCHQTLLPDFSSAPIIPGVLKHSSNLSNGSIWNSTAAPYWATGNSPCYYCHNNTKHNSTALGKISSLLSDANNTRNGSLAVTTWCADCHYNTSNVNYRGNEWTPVPPLITINNTGKSYWQNHSTFLTSGIKDNNCKSCHALNGSYLVTSLNYSHSLNEGVAGNPNCISCHDYGRTEAQHRINNSVMNSSSAIHKNLNSNAANSSFVSGENKKCWGCHDSTGTQPPNGSMGDRYTDPYRCYDCHNETKPYANVSNALNVSEHFKGGEIKAASNASDNSSSCLVCHNLSEMLLSYAEDDVFNSSYSIVSHYGIRRTDLRTWDSGVAVNCSYCHQNESTAFASAMVNSAYNSSIANHSRNNSPACYNSTCHASGWIHNSTLVRPALPLPNTTYCQICHASKQKHNDTVDCSTCHINSTSNDTIHPIKYIQRNGSFATANTTAANCTNCHQGSGLVNFSNATKIPAPLNHSTDTYSGGKWGSYWNNNSIITACYYCHQNDTHKAGAALLGNVSFIKGSNIFKNSNLSNSTWCANCHYAVAIEYNGTNLTPPPPEITNSSLNASDGTSFFNHSGFTNYNDSSCKTCHGEALAGYLETTLNFSHSLSEGGGGPDCISCHDIAGSGAPADKRITATSIRQGVHGNLNSNATNSTSLDPVNKACWACHGDGTEPVGHPARYKTPRQCSDNDCHSLAQSFKAPMVYSHFKDAELNSNPTNVTNFNVSAEVSCETCHSNSRNAENGNLNASVSHYATRDNLIDSMNCIYCHLNRDNSRDWGNATEINKNRSGLIEFDRLRNKFTAYSDEFVDLGAGYRMRITGVSPQRGSAIIELYKGGAIVDIGLVNIGRYVYEETRMIDNASSRVPVIVLNITSMFVSDNTGFIQFEGFRIKRVHPESRATSCYLCHFTAGVEKHKYTVIDRQDDYVYYTEVFANSSDRNEYDQQEALRILANKTPLDVRAGIERPKRKTLGVGEKWMLAQNYSLTLEEVAENRDSARFLLEVDGNRFTDIVKRGEWLSYEMSINYLGYVYMKIVIFRAKVSEISANLVVLEDILALSPEIKKIKDNQSIYGHNASWQWENDTFMTGAIPLSLHAPLLYDGKDGDAACTTCHSVGELGAHINVNSLAASSAAHENKACWACHGDGKEPKWHPANYKSPRDCKSCHVEPGITYNATYIGDEKHGALVNCGQCHVSDTHKIIRFSVQPGIRRLSLSKQEVNAGETIKIDATAVAGFEMRIRAAEYYIDSPVNITPMSAVDGSFDEQVEEVTGGIDTSGLEIGNHTVYVRAMERSNKWGPESSVSFAVTGKAAVMADATQTAIIIMVGIFAFGVIIIFVLPLLRGRLFA